MTMSTPSLSEATRVWAKIGILSFGGPAAQIALMHKEVVDDRDWLSESQFLNALSFCMLLPGPEAMQLATYAGWRMHGIRGGLIAGGLFVLPGALVMLALSMLYAVFWQVPFINALFLGVKAAVIIIVIEALLRVSKKALSGTAHWVIAALAFIGIFLLALPYPLIVLAAGIYGFLFSRSKTENSEPVPSKYSFTKTLQTIAVWLAIWWGPLLALRIVSPGSQLNEIGLFFSKLATVTFGGAYAVLAYMGQDVVENSQWLTAGQMMDGLGLAETTPGPLILVTQFVGFLAGYAQSGMGFAVLAALVTLWATFIPCFLWIFTGAPYIDWISHQPRLMGALGAITAAVVGVILNLSIWFALHVFFSQVTTRSYGPITTSVPTLNTLDWRVVVLTLLAAFLSFRLRFGILKMLIICSGVGSVLSQF